MFATLGKIVIGAVIGGVVTYIMTALIERRRNRETEANAAKRFRAVADTMPKLLAEMQEDLSNQPHTRRVFRLSSDKQGFGGTTEVALFYFENEHEDLAGCLDRLDNLGYIKNVTTPGNYVQEYRMSEEFVALVTAYDFGERTD
jgi:hypothetical protein